MGKAVFRFYAELNDFLDSDKRQKPFEYRFFGNPSIKDAIQAIGVMHTEVDLILVNSNFVDFDYNLNDGDFVSVYPVFESIDISPLKGLTPPLRVLRFIADVHLGKLAKYLRMLGFDTLYSNNAEDSEIMETAQTEGRVILTKDKGILKNGRVDKGYFVRSDKAKMQIKEVVKRFDLYSGIEPFKRCMVCNGEIVNVHKSDIINRIPPKTRLYYDEFRICKSCGRIYWKGSHYQKMMQFIEDIRLPH